MRFTTRPSIFLLCILLSSALTAQTSDAWLNQWQNPSANFFTIQHSFDSAWADKEQQMRTHNVSISADRGEESEQDGTFQLFKRWEWYYAPRVGPAGDLTLPAYSYFNFFSYIEQNPAAKAMRDASMLRQTSANNWTFVGPTGAPGGSGAGRINFVRLDPSNPNTIYAGAPAGGLWKSVNGGASWTSMTDFLPIIGCSDLAIDPNNSDVLYLGTGDQDGGDTPSIGVMKSTDGGITWNSTGLNFNIIQSRKIARIIIDPTNSNIVYCGTSAGIFKTYDAGVNWSQISASGIKDMEMKPGDPNTLYACRTTVIMTNNGGASWNNVTAGLPQANQVSRLALAVTPNDANYVYVLAGAVGTNGFQGVYCSTNSGQSFTPRASSPNLLGWDPNGGDTDGQAWYDLAIQVAPYDKDVVIVGGVNVWRSDDGGINWSLNAHWYGGGGAPYVHADVHGIEFLSGTLGTYFVACDGGVFATTDDGASFSDLSNNMCIAQIYKLGASALNAGTLITGHQDNGTNLKVGSSYNEVLGGDGMDCFIDRTNDNNMFGELYYGDFHKSTDGGQSWSGATNGLSGNAGWVTPWKQDPVSANTIYCGYDQVFISTNLGNSWTQLGNLPNASSLTEIEIAPTNTQCIYTTNASSIFRTLDGGASWTNITGSLLTNGTEITGITISPYDENTLWISFGGYTTTSKAYYSTDAGTTWTNISYGLPNIPANAIKAVPNTGNNLIFIGMDAGVYYRSDISNGWQPYFSALPLAPISDFEIFEPTMMLRASTYGRGVWECPIDAALLTPLAAFTSNSTTVCPGQTIQFTDLSIGNPTTWSWAFAGGSPSVSSQQNPAITYATPGTYPVTLSAANANGSDILVATGYVTVNGATVPPLIEGFTSATFVPTGWSPVNNGNQSVFWQRSATVGHNSSQSAFFNNFNNNLNGATDDIVAPAVNLIGYSAPSLQFDIAYARYSASRSDTLEVLVSNDCGTTWTSVYVKGGSNLSTVSDQTSTFTPNNNQWRTETISLAAYANSSSLQVAFRNHGRHGNFIYLDNINLSAITTSAPIALFNHTQACVEDSIVFSDLSSPDPSSWSWSFPGGSPATSNLQNPHVLWTSAGTYTATLIATNSFGADTITQTIVVNNAPIAYAGADTAYCSTTYIPLHGAGGLTYTWSPSVGMYNSSMQNPLVYTTTSTTFSLTVTDSVGCTATDTVRVNILPLPGFTNTASDVSICYGDTISIVCSNSQWSYTWAPTSSLNLSSGDSVIAFPASSVSYTITSTDPNTGCTASAVRSITVFPYLPSPSILVWGFNLTCSTVANSYQWYLNGNPIAGATQQSYLATQVGMYQVEAYNSQGCSSGISTAMLVDAIPEVNISAFSIYPNPNEGVFTVSFSGESNTDYTIEIISANGSVVETERTRSPAGNYKKDFDLSSYGSGVYLLRVTHNNQSSSYRMIVY